jgi:hypothetical protein
MAAPVAWDLIILGVYCKLNYLCFALKSIASVISPASPDIVAVSVIRCN